MIDVRAPEEQEGTKAVVRGWLKKVGDVVAVNDPLVELETDKVTMEVPAPAAGVLAEIVLESDAEAAPGAVLGRLRAPEDSVRPEPLDCLPRQALGINQGRGGLPSEAEAIVLGSARTGVSTSLDTNGSQRLSPAVRRAVQQHGVDPATVAGSGRGGRITRADVDRVVEARGSAPTSSRGGSRSIPHDRMRRLIADNMLNSVTVAPHVTAVFEADFSAIIAHRRAHKAEFERDGVNLTLTAYFVAAAARAMRAAPTINSRWHDDRLEIFDDVNIGVGTALGDKGLIVPVVRRAQDQSLMGIARQLDDLVGRARTGKLKPADVQGGTFTISNHGTSGSLVATPIIINQPQSAILGIGKLEKRVVVREVDGADAIQIRPMAYVSLTIDHRVVDGHQTNLWLSSFVETIEGWPR